MTLNQKTAYVIETGESPFAVTIDVSGHTIQGDEPAATGGKNLGPSPYDLLLAALGECTTMTVRWYAQSKNWPLEKVEVRLTHHKEERTTDVFTKEIILHGQQLSEEQRIRLIEIASKCPIQKTLESTPYIITFAEKQ